MKARERKRARMVARYAEKRAALKAAGDWEGLQKLPPNSAAVRMHNRCQITGRPHTFTAGAGWAYDYGTSDQSEEMFSYLKSYSPVHNVQERAYPATMVTTGDHDDRVVPAHSFKFAAHLQDKNLSPNPMIIRIDKEAGHGSGTPVSKIIDQYADKFGFALFNMGFFDLPVPIQLKQSLPEANT